MGRWEPTGDPGAVEVAIVIEDAWQGRGLGAVLFRLLLEAAAARGVRRFGADVLAENERMLRLIRTLAVVEASRVADGVVHLAFTRRDGPVAPAEGRMVGGRRVA